MSVFHIFLLNIVTVCLCVFVSIPMDRISTKRTSHWQRLALSFYHFMKDSFFSSFLSHTNSLFFISSVILRLMTCKTLRLEVNRRTHEEVYSDSVGRQEEKMPFFEVSPIKTLTHTCGHIRGRSISTSTIIMRKQNETKCIAFVSVYLPIVFHFASLKLPLIFSAE